METNYYYNIVPDLLARNPDIITLFESPSHDELKAKCMLMGRAGKRFAQTLLGVTDDMSAGEWFTEDKSVSMMNSMQIAIDLNDKLADFRTRIKPNNPEHLGSLEQQKVIREIPFILDYCKTNYFDRVSNELLKAFIAKSKAHYGGIVPRAFNSPDCIVKILICGATAKAFFSQAFNTSIPGMHCPSFSKQLIIKDNKGEENRIPVLIFYTHHPVHDNWGEKSQDLDNLLEFWRTDAGTYNKDLHDFVNTL